MPSRDVLKVLEKHLKTEKHQRVVEELNSPKNLKNSKKNSELPKHAVRKKIKEPIPECGKSLAKKQTLKFSCETCTKE